MSLTIEQVAQVAHEANRAFCATLGDLSQVPWSEAPDWQKTSALHNAEYHLANPGDAVDASHSHVVWMKDKLDAGWKWGPVKKPELLEHPDLVPFDQLSLSAQAKDVLFRSVVLSLAPLVG